MASEEERSSSGDRGSVVTLDPDTMEDQSNGTAEDTGTSTMRHRGVTSKMEPPSDSEAKGAQMGEHPQTVRRNPRFAIRAATPTHRRPKESPLSSSAIFNEVFPTSILHDAALNEYIELAKSFIVRHGL